jgi:hypothetical protein
MEILWIVVCGPRASVYFDLDVVNTVRHGPRIIYLPPAVPNDRPHECPETFLGTQARLMGKYEVLLR